MAGLCELSEMTKTTELQVREAHACAFRVACSRLVVYSSWLIVYGLWLTIYIVGARRFFSLCGFIREGYMGTLLIGNTPLVGPCSSPMPRDLWWSWGGLLFLMGEVPL